MDPTDAPHPPNCPRCGHSQAGHLAPAAEAWPLESCCAECGLSIRWGEFFRSEHDLPRWWVEHAPIRRLLLAIPPTCLVSLVGWPLWKRLRMEHPIRRGRLVLAVVLVGIAIYAGILMEVLSPVLRSAIRQPSRIQSIMASNPLVFTVHTPQGTGLFRGTVQAPSVMSWFAVCSPYVLTPWSSMAPETRVRLDLTSRVSEDEAAFATWVVEVNQHDRPRSPKPLAPGLQPGSPGIPKSIEGPLAGYQVLESPSRVWLPWVQRSGYGVAYTAVLLAGSVLSFAALPIARRRAKIRAAHLVRAAFYLALGPALLIGLLTTSVEPLGLYASDTPSIVGTRLDVALASGALLVAWWRLAAGWYLRMARPWAVAASVTAIAWVLSLAAAPLQFIA